MGKEGEADYRRQNHSPRKRRNGGTPIGLIEGTMWNVDPLLSDCEISKYAAAVTE
jgi:hypothetical protein